MMPPGTADGTASPGSVAVGSGEPAGVGLTDAAGAAGVPVGSAVAVAGWGVAATPAGVVAGAAGVAAGDDGDGGATVAEGVAGADAAVSTAAGQPSSRSAAVNAPPGSSVIDCGWGWKPGTETPIGGGSIAQVAASPVRWYRTSSAAARSVTAAPG